MEVNEIMQTNSVYCDEEMTVQMLRSHREYSINASWIQGISYAFSQFDESLEM